MSGAIQLALVAVVVATILLVLRLVRQRRLQGKYVLLWLSVCVLMLLLALGPTGLTTSCSTRASSTPRPRTCSSASAAPVRRGRAPVDRALAPRRADACAGRRGRAAPERPRRAQGSGWTDLTAPGSASASPR